VQSLVNGLDLAFYRVMRVSIPTEANLRGGLKALSAVPRRCEKSSTSSNLGRKQAGFNQQSAKTTPPLQVELVCRDETNGFDPFWDAPRLVPAFVTQVLAQAMPERRDHLAVETAYGRAFCPRKALLLDRKS
jgi:hypothetical protein